MIKPNYENSLRECLDNLQKLLIKKQHDYGSDNLKRHGLFGIIVRIDDKIARVTNLSKLDSASVSDETIKDTLLDIAGYAIQAVLLLDERL